MIISASNLQQKALGELGKASTKKGPLDPTHYQVIGVIRGQTKHCAELALNVLPWLSKAQRMFTVDEIRVAGTRSI